MTGVTSGRVLVTGSSGTIGRTLVEGLPAHGYAVRGLDRVAPPDSGLDALTGELLDAALLDRALADVHAVVHLAAHPGEAPLEEELTSHVLGTQAVLQAARRQGIKRVVLASSNHAVGRTPRGGLPDGRLTVDVRQRPDTFYGVAKVALEGLGSLYADRYGLEVVALRIGSFQPRPRSRRHLATWLSPGDAVRLVVASLSAPDVAYEVVHGVSANTRGWWDHEPGRRLGYLAQDDAEAFADDVLAVPETEQDRRDGEFVGGEFVDAEYDVPASVSPPRPPA